MFNLIWRSVNGFKVCNVGDHIIMFVFNNEEKVENFFEGEPWSFDKHLEMIQRYDNSIPIRYLVFNQVSIWVQVHDIPIRYLNCEVVEDLCEVVGVVNDSIITDVDKRCIMRIRVRVDVSLPLYKGRIFLLENFSRGWVSLKYECLPNICYWCGCINHFDKDHDLSNRKQWYVNSKRLAIWSMDSCLFLAHA